MLELRALPGYMEVVEGKVEHGCIEPLVFWASGVRAERMAVRSNAGEVDVSRGVLSPEVGTHRLEWGLGGDEG